MSDEALAVPGAFAVVGDEGVAGDVETGVDEDAAGASDCAKAVLAGATDIKPRKTRKNTLKNPGTFGKIRPRLAV